MWSHAWIWYINYVVPSLNLIYQLCGPMPESDISITWPHAWMIWYINYMAQCLNLIYQLHGPMPESDISITWLHAWIWYIIINYMAPCLNLMYINYMAPCLNLIYQLHGPIPEPHESDNPKNDIKWKMGSSYREVQKHEWNSRSPNFNLIVSHLVSVWGLSGSYMGPQKYATSAAVSKLCQTVQACGNQEELG